MNDNDNDNNSSEVEAETEAGSAEKTQSIGQVLQAARLAQVMSVQDIARQLRLTEKQVTAIEEDDHSKFPSQTFLRGFIRNYAKLVRQNTEEFSQLLQQTFPLASTQAISYPVDGTPFTPDHKQSRGNIIIVLVAVLVSLLLIYEVYRSGGDENQADTSIENRTTADTTIEFETEVEQMPNDDQNQLPSMISSNGSKFNSLSEEDKTEQQDGLDRKQQIKVVPEVEDKPVKKEGERALRFIFNEDSWVEVKDAKGKRVLSQIGPGNTEKTVYGRATFFSDYWECC